MFRLLFILTLFSRCFLSANEPLPGEVAGHIEKVKKELKLSFLGKGATPFGDGVFDLEFVSWEASTQEEGRALIQQAVRDLRKRLADTPVENIRYGISFLDRGGDLRKEGIARIWAVKPRKGKEVKIFYSEFKDGKLETLSVENFD